MKDNEGAWVLVALMVGGGAIRHMMHFHGHSFIKRVCSMSIVWLFNWINFDNQRLISPAGARRSEGGGGPIAAAIIHAA